VTILLLLKHFFLFPSQVCHLSRKREAGRPFRLRLILTCTEVYKRIGLARAVLCLIPATCLPGHIEPDVLRPYRHVLQRGGHWAPTHHTVTSCLYLIILGVTVLSSHLPAPDAPNCADDVLRTRLTVLQLKRSGANVARAFLQ